MEISLADLLTLEPRLRPWAGVQGAAAEEPRLDRAAVSWAVAARATPPHLPPLRGGELLLLPPRAMAALGDELPALLRESLAREVCGIVVADEATAPLTTYPASGKTRVLTWEGALTADNEADINRLLTECRGNLYRVGTELERRMADAAANLAGLAALTTIVSETTGLRVAVVDAEGRQLATAPDSAATDRPDACGPGLSSRGLMRGATLLLDAERPDLRIMARFLADRIVAAANAALQRDVAARPRGAGRAEATARLLAGGGSASDQRARALALGLDPDALYVVAISDVDSVATLAHALAPLGLAQAAGSANGRHVALVAASRRIPSDTLTGRVREVTARWEEEPETRLYALALSGPAFGVASLRRAATEAEFVTAMQSMGDVPRRAASFGSVADLGAMGLLYHLRDSMELQGFVAEALGALPERDDRGTLRATLRAFLESGGSQVDASRRLGIHRNTLAYRLRRIGELVGRDVADPGGWLTLNLALRASDMLAVFPEPR